MKLTILLSLNLVLASLTAQTLPPRKLDVCGSHDARTRQAVFLDRQATKQRAGGSISFRAPAKEKRRLASGFPSVLSADGQPANPMFLPLNPFDLENRSLVFSPVQASASSYRYAVDGVQYDATKSAFPATRLPVSDDDSYRVTLPFPFPFYGKTYTEVWVNTNGHLTFERPDPSYRNLTPAAFEQGPPRISPIMADFFPDFSFETVGIFQLLSSTSVTFTWKDVPLFDSLFEPELKPISLQVQLSPDGSIRFSYLPVEEGAYVVGISPGGEVAQQATFVDFTEPSPATHAIGVFEVYSDFPELNVPEATRQFYSFYSQRNGVSLARSDVADVLVFFTEFPGSAGPGAIAYNLPIRNSVKGIGLDQFDYGEDFGSPSRLKAVINMGSIQQYPLRSDRVIPGYESSGDTALTIFAHEFAHMFLAYPKIQVGSQQSEAILGRQSAHWSFNFNSDGSVLEGNRIEQVEAGEISQFETKGTSSRYSELDLYLMGYTAPQSVGVSQELFYVADSTVKSTEPTAKGVRFQGRKVPILLSDIIAAAGPRIPDHRASQKKFEVIFVFVDRDGIVKIVENADTLSEFDGPGFGNFLNGLTKTSGVIEGYPNMGIQPQPNAGLPLGRPVAFQFYEMSSSGALVGGSWPAKSLQVESEGGVLEHPAVLTGDALNPIVSVNAKGIHEGFGKLRVTGDKSAQFETQETQIRVLDESKLRLQLLSGNRQQVGPGGTAPNSISVRVVDDLGIPYRSVSVSAEALTGGQLYPSPQLSSEFGEVRFQWTAGDLSENSAAIFVTSNRAATTVPIQTVQDKSILVGAATNAASFAPGITPGSLATLFGVNLSASAVAQAQSLPLPLSLAKVGLRINGERAPLLYVGPGQINFLVPPNLTNGIAQIDVTTPDGKSSAAEVTVIPVSPGIFFDSEGDMGAILPAGTGQKTNTRPAKAGEYVEVFATGLGAVVPSPDNPDLFLTLEVPVALVDGVEIPVSFSGLAPGFVGLNQVNVKLPDNLTPGRHEMRLRSNGVVSKAVVFYSE